MNATVLPGPGHAREELERKANELLQAEYQRPWFAGNYEDAAVDAIMIALCTPLVQEPKTEGDMERALDWLLGAVGGKPGSAEHLRSIKEAIAAYDPERMARCGNTARGDVRRVDAPRIDATPDHQQSSGNSGQLANNQNQLLEKIEQLPDASADGEAHLRWLLARVYSGANLYCDDGEMSDSSAHPAIDFLRDDSGIIESKICARTLTAATLCTPAKNGAAAWVVANPQGDKWRMWGDSGPEWTGDREKALQFARRDDAEAFSRDDEDAWLIQPLHGLEPGK